MANPVKYAGLNTLSTEELDDLRQAIEDELESRKKKVCESISDSLENELRSILNRGFSLIIEDTDDEFEITPETIKCLEVTVYPSIPDINRIRI